MKKSSPASLIQLNDQKWAIFILISLASIFISPTSYNHFFQCVTSYRAQWSYLPSIVDLKIFSMPWQEYLVLGCLEIALCLTLALFYRYGKKKNFSLHTWYKRIIYLVLPAILISFSFHFFFSGILIGGNFFIENNQYVLKPLDRTWHISTLFSLAVRYMPLIELVNYLFHQRVKSSSTTKL